MNREIKFRGFHEYSNGKETIYVNGRKYVGEWVYGYYVKSNFKKSKNRYYITWENPETWSSYTPIMQIKLIEVIPETVSQYTGLKDKNVKEIYENDDVTSEYGIFKATVEWNDSFCGYFPFCNIETEIFANECEVIGTIFDKEVEE